MIHVSTSISLYILVIAIILPFIFGNVGENKNWVDDSIMIVMMSCVSLLEVCPTVQDKINSKHFVIRKRKCCSDIFLELGDYWTKISYRFFCLEVIQFHHPTLSNKDAI